MAARHWLLGGIGACACVNCYNPIVLRAPVGEESPLKRVPVSQIGPMWWLEAVMVVAGLLNDWLETSLLVMGLAVLRVFMRPMLMLVGGLILLPFLYYKK